MFKIYKGRGQRGNLLSDSQVLRHTDLSASANFSHRTASFTYVQLSAYHTHTVCIFCPHFLTALLKGQCKFPITLGLTVFTQSPNAYVSLPWPRQRLSLPSRGEAGRPPHLQIVTQSRYTDIFMVETILTRLSTYLQHSRVLRHPHTLGGKIIRDQ